MQIYVKWLLGGGLGLSFLGVFLVMYAYVLIQKESENPSSIHEGQKKAVWNMPKPMKPLAVYFGFGFIAMGYLFQLGGIVLS